MSPEDQRSNEAELTAQVSAALRAAVARIVPRFLQTMPPGYFHDTDEATRREHLQALIAAEAGGLPQDLTLRSSDGRQITFIRESSYPGLLAELVARLPAAPPLCAARVHTATDGRLILDTFVLGAPTLCDASDPRQAAAIEQTVATLTADAGLSEAGLRDHLAGAAAEYVLRVPPERVADHFRLLESLRDSDLCETRIAPVPGSPHLRITVASPSREGRDLFARIAGYLGGLGIDIRRAHVDLFRQRDRVASIITVLAAVPAGTDQRRLGDDLARLRYLDDSVISLWHDVGDLTLSESEVLVALGRLAHQRLTELDRLTYTRDRIEGVLRDAPGPTRALARRLLARLAPGQAAPPTEPVLEMRDDLCRTVLETMQTIAESVLRGNVHVTQRRSLALRLPGAALGAAGAGEVPYGVFFVHGRNFDGFHLRFRDIARGGIRIVCPTGAEQFSLESERLYLEAYQLAYAQQLKNKDIPEGGAKGVLLTAPGSDAAAAARAYADGLLDLIAPDPRTRDQIGNPPETPELLYLGPDENITNDLINWITRRAAQRSYPLPTAFMSSKPEAGINHKQYGVTSEGVAVYLDVALRNLGLDPRSKAFAVTLTGGPDGDVAGNQIRILHREYGRNARIVGIADGSGSAEDPEGLDHDELLRLVAGVQPIARFDPARLGPRGRVLPLEAEGGVTARNTLHTRLSADAFVPAGGRPATIDDDNWTAFLRADGRPVSPLIVEGANLFLTPGARAALSSRGVLIVKDSSANKCGVICSSFEILACMLFDEAAFLARKERFVDEVLIKLRNLARVEADALFREKRSRPELSLPELSERLSRAINRTTDALADQMPVVRAEHPGIPLALLRQHLPAILLAEQPAARLAALPPSYVDRALASMLAGRIVYREGLGLVEQMQPEPLRDLVLGYLLQEAETSHLADLVAASDLPQRARIAGLLREGGTAAGLRLGPLEPTAEE